MTVMLVSDDAVLASGVLHILQQSAAFEFEHLSPFPVSTLPTRLTTRTPNVLLLDVEGGVTLNTIEEIRKCNPDCHICLWGRSIPDDLAYQAMTLGVKGILRRNVPIGDLLTCLRRLADGSVWFEERLMAGFFSNRVVRLTRRESQLVNLLAQGLKNKEIAWQLSLSEGTVKVYFSRLFEKLGVKDRFELALYGLRNLSMGESQETPSPTVPAPVYANSMMKLQNSFGRR